MGEVSDRLTAALAGRYAIAREVGAGGMASTRATKGVDMKRGLWSWPAMTLITALVFAIADGAAAQSQPLPATTPAAVGMSAERLARIRPVLQRYVDDAQVAGALALVVRDGKVVALDSAGYADIEGRKPMGRTAIFRMMSMTKPITAVAAMILVEEGKIALADPVSKYIPSFAGVRVLNRDGTQGGVSTVAPRRAITVRDLMTHRSGITYGFNDNPAAAIYREAGVEDGLASSELSLAQNADLIAAQPLLHQPGSAYEYGLGIDVLGRVVEVASGMDLAAFMEARIFRPLRMTDTYFVLPDQKADRIAAVYNRNASTLRPIGPRETIGLGRVTGIGTRGSSLLSGGAGLFSTALDYARFLQMVLNGGELDGARILSPATVRYMTTSHTSDLGRGVANPGQDYGLGFGVRVDPGQTPTAQSVGTFGWGGAFSTSGYADPAQDLIVLVLTQRYPTAGLTLVQAVTGVVYGAIEVEGDVGTPNPRIAVGGGR
jgi:CubicO group peptidase (beta-lactamase class C family)